MIPNFRKYVNDCFEDSRLSGCNVATGLKGQEKLESRTGAAAELYLRIGSKPAEKWAPW